MLSFQLVVKRSNTDDCESSIHGFESRLADKYKKLKELILCNKDSKEHIKKYNYSLLAKLVRHLTLNQVITGSNPVERIWAYRIVVITLDCLSKYGGSIPPMLAIMEKWWKLVNMAEKKLRWHTWNLNADNCKGYLVGSNPTFSTPFIIHL